MRNNRNPGMDLIRIASMVMVFISHTSVFSTNRESFFGVRYVFGELGVTGFLVLSAYLVGTGIFRAPDDFSVRKFYVNRLLRLIPAYYVAIFFTAWLNHTSFPMICLSLLQNYDFNALSFIPPTWSLCIEEWSYFPILILALLLCLIFKKNRKKAFIVSAALLAVVALILRAVMLIQNPGVDHNFIDFAIRKRTQCRIDTFSIGILTAAFEQLKPDAFKKFMGNLWMNILAGVGFVGSLLVWYKLLGGTTNTAARYLVFTVLPLCTMFFVIRLKDLSLWKKPALLKASNPLKFMAELTYPAYLVHFQFYILVSNYCNDNLIWNRAWPFILTLLMTFGWALAVHFIVEMPFNRLRRTLVSKIHL